MYLQYTVEEAFADAQPILDYFEDTFIGRPGRHNRLGPVFSLHIWNMYDRTAQHQHHRKLSPWIQVSHCTRKKQPLISSSGNTLRTAFREAATS
jgi:hypothetical protein